jgi:hypothetical protein
MLSCVIDVIFPQRHVPHIATSRGETHLVAQRKTTNKQCGKGRRAVKPAKASPKKRAGSARQTPEGKKPTAGTRQVTIDRRRKAGRRVDDRAATPKSPVPPPKLERRKKVNRRRQIDPTTCERDYTGDEIEFMNALDEYKRTSGRMFPTCSEVLEVVRSLGYVKGLPHELAEVHAADDAAPAKPHIAMSADVPQLMSVE